MTRIEREKATVAKIIALYCLRQDGGKELCRDCRELLVYAHERLDSCPYGSSKSSCKKCTIHCYKPDMRNRMKAVMRFAGPRMLLHHPVAAIRHILE